MPCGYFMVRFDSRSMISEVWSRYNQVGSGLIKCVLVKKPGRMELAGWTESSTSWLGWVELIFFLFPFSPCCHTTIQYFFFFVIQLTQPYPKPYLWCSQEGKSFFFSFVFVGVCILPFSTGFSFLSTEQRDKTKMGEKMKKEKFKMKTIFSFFG